MTDVKKQKDYPSKTYYFPTSSQVSNADEKIMWIRLHSSLRSSIQNSCHDRKNNISASNPQIKTNNKDEYSDVLPKQK